MRFVSGIRFTHWMGSALITAALASGCSSDPGAPSGGGDKEVDLVNRAYIVSRDSGDVTVIDLNRMEVVASFDTRGSHNHMAELNRDFTKAYVDSPGTNETIVFDTRTFDQIKRVKLGAEPTHLALSRDGKYLGIVNEASNEVSFLDTERDEEVKRLTGFDMPHFVRFTPDGRHAYVANVGAHHITRLDLATLSIEEHIVLDGFEGPPNATPAPDEGGFADVQIDTTGVLYAAHAKTGRVLVYDTVAQKKKAELAVGNNPWIVYAEHPFAQITRHVVPNFGDETVSIIRPAESALGGIVQAADRESFGVNYSPLMPNLAYVMNRFRSEIAVVDTVEAKLLTTIPVGGTTETASTTEDGKYIVAAVSSDDAVVVINASTREIVKRFARVGRYPWSVTIPRGQNYCH